ncbi:hypothetical protein EPR50_G00027370 [Perca flavescens]|uniref:Protein NPAT C-terminal domain-containing protein n=1 Tax=Perca flavescens TaxID=8167 RepID=A0A484DIP1_PERFV|nr:hypothetical protein EPR50_G00027370 [Perca flavescens]
MLLPSDVARLVLGYLQEEGLSATSRTFILECQNLKEYAEHTTEDGTIPACVFSIFGKGLTTILNEYVSAKTKAESCHEVPAMMTSLWKKLDFTLNQIKSLQNSPALSASQRTRSRIGVANMARQRVLTVASASGVVCSSVSETSSIISPAHISHSMLGHSTPVSYTATHTRPVTGSGTPQQIQDVNQSLNTPRDSPIQIIVSEHRLNPGPMSPGRRKWDTPRKRGGAQSGSGAPGRCAVTVSAPNAESQPEEAVDENFPQLVIQNARDKILGDRSLQEKLAENINKILANEPTPQTSKAPSSTVEADQSIDEILGLQGEIHMSDDAIHDILEQTESDPAFHALFELFDYNKTRFTDGDPGEGDISSSPEESDTAGPSSTVIPLQSDDPGTTHKDSKALATTPMTVKMRAGQELGAAPNPPTTNPTTPSKAAADSSNIVSLKIIISDNQDEDSSSDPNLNQAISSISRDKIPTIYLSSPAKSSGGGPGTPKANLDEAAQAVSGLQCAEAYASPLSCKAGALVASPLTGTSQAQQNYIIQLPLDTTNPTLQGATASYFLVTEPQTTDAQTRQVLLSAGVAKGPPLPANQYGVTTPTRSRGYSTGSTFILPSPVNKPMMLPVSVMGPNTLGKVQMVSNQLVAIPNPVLVQQSEDLKPKSPTMAIKWSTPAGTEQNLVGKLVQPVLAENTGQQETAKDTRHRRILCFDSNAEVQPQTAKTTRTTKPPATNTSTSQSVQQTEKDNTQSVARRKPTILGGNKPKRRIETVRCSADPQTGGGFLKEAEKAMPPQQHQKDPPKKNSRKQDHSIHNEESQRASTSRVDASQPETLKKSESGRRSKSIDRKSNHDKDGNGAKAKDAHTSRSLSSDSALKSGTRKEKEESCRKEPAEKAPVKSCEGRTEKRTPSQEMPNVTANKENEIKGSLQEQQQQHSTPSSSTLRDFSPPVVTQPASNPQSKATKAPSKTSSLAKQAAEMLQDIQGLSSPSTPIKRPGVGSSDSSVPRTPGTGRNQAESAERPRTPSRPKKGRDGEGTPKHLMPPNTPDVPTCSPASEAGSENSINMAAHTLMILSRAAIARTGTPLKDSLRQEEVGENLPASSKSSKKRKPSSPTASPPAKKKSKQSPSKKTDRERKKLADCFPHDLDVDKFLSSLHYDE